MGSAAFFNPVKQYVRLDGFNNKTLYITSTKTVEWDTDEGIQLNVELNGEVGHGRIQAGEYVPITFFSDQNECEGYFTFRNGERIIRIFVRCQMA